MVEGAAVLLNGIAMFTGGISLVLLPVVHGELLMDLRHKVIAVGLGQDRGSGNVEIFTVPFDDAFVRDLAVIFKAVSDLPL